MLGSRASWAVIVALCAPLGCAWHRPGAPGGLAAPRADQASLVVRLADLPDGGRRLLQAPAVRLRVSVVDGKGTALKEEAVAGSAGEVRLEGLPTAPRVLVTLVRLDGAGQPVPGSQVRSVGALVAGANVLPLSAAASRAGDMVAALQALDRAAGTAVADGLGYAALPGAMLAWQRALKAPQVTLLDAEAIARAWHQAKALPPTSAAFYPSPARLVLEPTLWPPGAIADVTLSDPASLGRTLDGEKVVMEPLPPGSWRVTVAPRDDGLASATYDVSLDPGETLVLPVGFGQHAQQAPLPVARGGAIAAAVPQASGTALLMAGGNVLTPREASPKEPLPSDEIRLLPAPATSPPTGFSLPLAVFGAGHAVHGGLVYWFGGVGFGGLQATTGRIDPAAGTATLRAPLPNGRRLAVPAVAAIGPRIYLTGGLGTSGEPVAETLAYEPATDAWPTEALPVQPVPISAQAAAVVDGTMYLFGGEILVEGGRPQPIGQALAWKPGRDPAFVPIPELPTPRACAAAIAVAGRIWVIGGLDALGGLTGAVEVYDPVAKTWSLRPPLSVPRLFPAVGLVDGQIVVAGGVLGRDPAMGLPVSAVEHLQP
ncbi:MAG: kelch repeat-containing protein [Candidatus Sericytochromatia bacterium]|nr:kelch repeat-containing protein [Candidatus Sericytochromatia bacterium]